MSNTQSERFTNPRLSTLVDLTEMLSGLALVMFMWGHLIMLSTILIGPSAMNFLAGFLEDLYLAQFGGIAIAGTVLIHFVTAGRKLPMRIQEQVQFWKLASKLRHVDTWLWLVQVVSGMLILIFAAIHLWVIMTDFPIEAAKSSARVAMAYGWLYLPMVLLVELHLGVGLYRIMVKWTSFNRRSAAILKWVMTAAFVVVGYLILATFWSYGVRGGI